MKRFLILFSLVLLITTTSLAVTARRVPMVYRQPDGSCLTVLKCGDEHVHWLTTVDGQLLAEGPDGSLSPASEADSLRLVQSCQRAARRRASSIERLNTFPALGEPHSLVILAEYPDCRFLSATAADDFRRMLNEPHYADHGGTGSARDYYIDASMGQFAPHFDVVGPIMLSQPYAYYGTNDADGEDLHTEDMIIEACQTADAEVDFSLYDYDEDGVIDNVFVFYAGYGEATCPDKDTVWPQSWDIMEYCSSPIILDGVRLNHYACTNERDTQDVMDGIGTFVHEFGHVLGLPDLYSTNYTNAWTPGPWSVMDAGNYANDSHTPVLFSAYEQWCVGWLRPMELTEPAHVILPGLQSAHSAAFIATAQDNEYYVLENRQPWGWDAYLPGHGMLVWHIDYDPYLWRMNRVNNNGSHQYVDIIEADDVRSDGTCAGDPFPGAAGVTSFTAVTQPAFVTWQGEAMPSITAIAEVDGQISFDYDGGGPDHRVAQLQAPEALPALQVTADGFVAQWSEVDDAEAYQLRVFDYAQSPASASTDFTDFATQGLPAGWSTTAHSTYANANYSGRAIPSLRLTEAGQCLVTPTMHRITQLSFWHRGTSALIADDQLVISGLDAQSGQWVELWRTPVITAPGGLRVEYQPDREVCALSIGFDLQSLTGSLAIDDVEVTGVELVRHSVWTDGAECETVEAPAQQHPVSGLQPAHTYYYTVQAVSGLLHSALSNEVTVTTSPQSAIQAIQADPHPAVRYYSPLGHRLPEPLPYGITLVRP